MPAPPRELLALFVGLAVAAPPARAQLVATPQKKGGVYGLGEKIVWTVEYRQPKAKDPKDPKGKDAGPEVKEASYVLKRGGRTQYQDGTLDLSAGSAAIETSLDEPGAVLLELRPKGDRKSPPTLAGALVEPDKIRPSAPRPADFDEFWAAKIQALEAVPANPRLEAADGGSPDVDYFKVRMDNVNDSHIYGQLAKPKKGDKFPALLIVQWAGVYRLQKPWVVNRARQGWLALNIEAHDLPFDEPDEFYVRAAQTTLKDYIHRGNDDREKSYFLRMYLSCYRAAEYLATRPDWDGRTLVVTGTSQGGQQAFVTAGLHPKVTALVANVPAGCDVTGPNVGRAAGFPYWAAQAQARKNDRILETGRYFDAVNFASRARGPALVAMGLIDETCPPAGVYAALNQVPGVREAVVMVDAAHQDRGGTQAAYYARSEAWLRALAKGEPVPPPAK